MIIKDGKKEDKSDNKMTLNEIIAQARGDYLVGDYKTFNSAEELIEDLNS